MLRFPSRIASRSLRQLQRRGLLTVSSMLPSDASVPTVDHLVSAERAAELMAERHIDAISVTKDERVIGMFTERDYFDKVLNTRHQATRSSMVCEVGLMGPDLVVARPSDSVEDCLTVMTRKNLVALPVVEDDGHAMGTVTMLDLTRQYMEEHAERAQTMQFSEPTYFPDNLILPDGGVHDEELGDPALFEQLAMDPTDALFEHANYELEGRAAEQFCEGSVFPEFTPTEEVMLAEAQGAGPSASARPGDFEREERFSAAHSEVLGRIGLFSQPSDYPEAAPVEEAIQARA